MGLLPPRGPVAPGRRGRSGHGKRQFFRGERSRGTKGNGRAPARRSALCRPGLARQTGFFSVSVGLQDHPAGGLAALAQLFLQQAHPLQDPLLRRGGRGLFLRLFFALCLFFGRFYFDVYLELQMQFGGLCRSGFLPLLLFEQREGHRLVKPQVQLRTPHDLLIEHLRQHTKGGQAQAVLPHYRHIRFNHRDVFDVLFHQQHPL